MTYRGHIAGGAAAALVTTEIAGASGPALVVGAAAVLVGSLAPDIDSPGSYIGRATGPLSYLLRWLVSNPLTWWFAGRRRVNPSRATKSRTYPFFFRVAFYSTVHRLLLGEDRALRWATLLEIGRRHMSRLSGHRMLTHSLLGILVLAVLFGGLALAAATLLSGRSPGILGHLLTGLPASFGAFEPSLSLALWAAAAFLAGEISHLALDMLTVSGVPLLLPGTERRFWLVPDVLRVRTG